ncbi:cardiomyopathy-associated protein 5 [Cheilinus undulatus]|uniref:cardiomyopathy-associated protein 5 n=1 Tax=Cheilinus undulatus TaxID=241271 RepID=UPI001BD4960E|nr:cardiomyopathy-associated protein 5 [Cheilinus undulatus]
MEECESLDTEMTELQGFQSETNSQDDEDEVEELQNSLREVVQDPSVKPKLQCLMVDPSFSMVTVQSEDSGIVWETASSRCSTPWASETSSTSEAYSMEGSAAAGKITIVFDEEKIVRRRTRSGGRSSRLGDRLSRPGSSRSASALGVERPEMAEVSLPNVKQEKTPAEPDLEELKDKDQQLFSLISEGYEILNIRVPSKLPTVDEEESTELQDNLSYLDQTPKIRSKNHYDWALNHVQPEDGEILDRKEPSEQDTSQSPTDTELSKTPTPKESSGDIDYFEKFTLLDVSASGDKTPERQEEAERPAVKPKEEEQKPAAETATDSPSASEESFVFVTDEEIVGEHLDEVFYGEGAPPDALQRRDNEEAEIGRMRMRRESQRSLKESGSVLFGSQETILTPIFISPGPPKIIDPILLEEPTAMSFMYSDLYEDAVGERRRSDEECSEAESVASEKSYRRRFSDSEETDGYLEKFTLKDETPAVEDRPGSTGEQPEGRMMWSQNKFEMTGCLTRVVQKEDKVKSEMPETQEVSGEKGADLGLQTTEEKKEEVAETAEEMEDIKLSPVADEESVQEAKPSGDLMEVQEVKDDSSEPLGIITDEPLPEIQQVGAKNEKTEEREERQGEETVTEPVIETTEKVSKMDLSAAEETAANESEIPSEKSLSEDAPTAEKVITEPETEVQEKSSPSEAQTSLIEEKDAAEDATPVQVTTDCDSSVHAVVEVIEKAVDEKEIQTQVQIDLQEVKRFETTEAAEEECEVKTEEAATESQVNETITDTEQESEVKTEIPCEPEEIKPDTDENQLESKQQEEAQQAKVESDQTKLRSESREETPTVSAGTVVQEMVSVGDELIVLVPKGQAVEMDIEVSPPEKTPAIPEHLISSESITVGPESPQETRAEPKQGAEPEDAPKDEVLPRGEVDDRFIPPVPVEEADTEQKMDQEAEGQAVKMISPLEMTPATPEHLLSPESIAVGQESLQEHLEETRAEPKQKAEPEDAPKDEVLPRSEVDDRFIPPVPVEEADTEQKMDQEIEGEAGDMTSPLEMTPATPEHLLSPEAEPQVVPKDEVPLRSAAEEQYIPPVLMEKAVEMNAEISPSDETPATPEPVSTCEYISPESIMVSQERLQEPLKETITEPELVAEPEDASKDGILPRNEFDDRYSPAVSVEEVDTEEQMTRQGFEEDEGVFSRLRSFTPLEDLSGLHREDLLSEEPEIEQGEDINKVEDIPETVMEDSRPEISLQREEEEQKMDPDETVVVDAPEVTVEEFGYEMIFEQDAKEMPQLETQRDKEEPKGELDQEREERMDVETEVEMEKKGEVFDLSPEEELIEADYDIIDAEEESQARLAAELQGMDWFCFPCGCLLSADDCSSGEHHNHEVTAVDQAYEEIKERLGDWISELQGRSENIEDLVSELELGYNSVEDQCVECEAAMQAQNDEMMALVMEQYNSMSVSMEEEKKAKLEQLYDQIVSFQESIDSAKATLETTVREAETDARSPEDIQSRLKAALDSAMSLELGPRGLLVFEDYAKGNTSSSHLAQRKGIPVPQRPTLQPQEAGSASSTSVTVYWKVNPGDIIDCFQVYCMEDPQGAVSEEYRVTVKESYCVLEELEPDKTYKVWVMAVNYTGCSLPSERLSFRTAPSVPVIDTERCAVMWDSATLRWSSANQSPEQSFTLEYCRQYELEGEGLRTISGIKSCEQKVLLQPNENYLFYIKAVNEAGASEQSEAALISTKGTKFGLLKATAHPALELSVDETTVHYCQDTPENSPTVDKLCPSILGELLPCKGQYYWETIVSGSTAYRLGVAYSSANRDSPLGENSQSWCFQCIPTPSGCRYQLLHNDVQSSVFVIDMPEQVGILLDYQLSRLSFFNSQTGQLLGAFYQHFAQPCHPALALEMPGRLEVSMVPEVPEFTKDS